MITIEEVIAFFEQGYDNDDHWAFKEPKEAAAVVRAQHEEIERLNRTNAADKLAALTMLRENQVEIERLRAELDLANKFIDQAFEAHPNLPLDIEFLEKSGEPK